MQKKKDKFTSLRENYSKYPKQQAKILKLVKAIKTDAGFKCHADDCFNIVRKKHSWCRTCKNKHAPKSKVTKSRYRTIEKIQKRLTVLAAQKRLKRPLIDSMTNATNSTCRAAKDMSRQEVFNIFGA